MDIKRDRKENDNNIPCPVCGGVGEVMNSNHFIADYAIGHRYETCRFCYGLGTISQQKYKEYLSGKNKKWSVPSETLPRD